MSLLGMDRWIDIGMDGQMAGHIEQQQYPVAPMAAEGENVRVPIKLTLWRWQLYLVHNVYKT